VSPGKPNGRAPGFVIIPTPQTITCYEWLEREMSQPDYLMGEVFSTTSRAMLAAKSGLGKTNFSLALAWAMAEGRDFLHWRAWRDGPANVLYVDGEMSMRLMHSRIGDARRRAGYIPESLNIFCYDELPMRPPPLNTPEGQEYFERFIKDRNYNFIVFDNIQALLTGNMVEEEPWKAVQLWTCSLTQRCIGQLWLHHTGHNTTRAYGSSTIGWGLDASIVLESVDHPVADISFILKFAKARDRTPDNRDDFKAVSITLERDRWLAEKVEATSGKPNCAAAPRSKPKAPSPLAERFHEGLLDALARAGERLPQSGNQPSVPRAQWIPELERLGLVDPVAAGADKKAAARQRALVSKYSRELIGASWIDINGDLVWSIRHLKNSS
jgi:hypothetical protein